MSTEEQREQGFSVTPGDFGRLEDKVDKLTDAVGRLVLIEDRQSAQVQRIDKLEAAREADREEHRKLERRVDKVLYMAMGAAGVLSFIFEILRTLVERH